MIWESFLSWREYSWPWGVRPKLIRGIDCMICPIRLRQGKAVNGDYLTLVILGSHDNSSKDWNSIIIISMTTTSKEDLNSSLRIPKCASLIRVPTTSEATLNAKTLCLWLMSSMAVVQSPKWSKFMVDQNKLGPGLYQETLEASSTGPPCLNPKALPNGRSTDNFIPYTEPRTLMTSIGSRMCKASNINICAPSHVTIIASQCQPHRESLVPRLCGNRSCSLSSSLKCKKELRPFRLFDSPYSPLHATFLFWPALKASTPTPLTSGQKWEGPDSSLLSWVSHLLFSLWKWLWCLDSLGINLWPLNGPSTMMIIHTRDCRSPNPRLRFVAENTGRHVFACSALHSPRTYSEIATSFWAPPAADDLSTEILMWNSIAPMTISICLSTLSSITVSEHNDDGVQVSYAPLLFFLISIRSANSHINLGQHLVLPTI